MYICLHWKSKWKRILNISYCFFIQVHWINVNITLLHTWHEICTYVYVYIRLALVHRYIIFLFLRQITIKFRIACLKLWYIIKYKNILIKIIKLIKLINNILSKIWFIFYFCQTILLFLFFMKWIFNWIYIHVYIHIYIHVYIYIHIHVYIFLSV